jgi:predicted permease
MKFIDSLRFRIATLFQHSKMNVEIDEELRSHIEHRADDLEGTGLPRAEAERRARIEFGGIERVGEEVHKAAGGIPGGTLFRDLQFAFRLLKKSPGFTVVAVLTLALAIGANTVVFSALNALILRPLNVPHAESLYSIHRITDNSANWSYLNYLDIRDRNRSFEDLVAWNLILAGLDTGDNPTRSWGLAVTGNYFDALSIGPHLGRVFHASDEHGPDSAPYIVLSHAYWHSHFQDDPNVVGRVVQVNKHPFTILGVTPPGFHGTLLFAAPDFFLPMVDQGQLEGTSALNDRGRRWIFMTMGHLKPGVTPEQAAADINSIGANLEKSYPKDYSHKPLVLARPSLYGDYLGRPARAFLSALMLLAGLILLAACANLGNLFAARAADRSREVALRLALGATRSRVLRQLFTEAILISLIGGAIGLWGSVLLLRSLATWQPFPQFPINVPVAPDATVYVVALLLALASGFLFGAVPVRQVLRTSPYEIVKSGARTTHGQRITGRDVLVVAQISICAVLVTSSIVAVRGLVGSMHGDFGFDSRNALLVNTILDMAGYRADAVPAMQKRMTDALETIPGVTAVGLVNGAPLTNADLNGAMVFKDETTDLRPANAAATAVLFEISPEYFRAAGTALLSGRKFSSQDDKHAPRVAIINQEFARRLFGSVSNALGGIYKMRDGTRVQVVGIAQDGKYEVLTEEPKPAVYLPILQSPSSDTYMVVRSANDPQQLAAAVRAKLHELDPGLPSFIQTWNESLGLILFPARVAAAALGLLGLIGAMLSLTGVFGMAAYSVSKRLRELGIRMALGAQRREVLQAALGRAFKLLAFGSAAGLVFGILASRVLAFIVYQATPRDPIVLAGAVLSMLLLGLLATWIPAQRALSVDPLILLREE